MEKYLSFVKTEYKGKTSIFNVINKNNELLGVIKWKPGWRRYVFISNYCDYDVKCLSEIISFITTLIDNRKK